VFFWVATDFTELMKGFWENGAVLIYRRVKINRRKSVLMDIAKKTGHHFSREIQGYPFFLEPW
jgi:hypothetical protein